jgi:hypothetical protein
MEEFVEMRGYARCRCIYTGPTFELGRRDLPLRCKLLAVATPADNQQIMINSVAHSHACMSLMDVPRGEELDKPLHHTSEHKKKRT